MTHKWNAEKQAMSKNLYETGPLKNRQTKEFTIRDSVKNRKKLGDMSR